MQAAVCFAVTYDARHVAVVVGRLREHLTAGEVEVLIDAAKDNRYGHQDATMILLAFRHVLQVAEASTISPRIALARTAAFGHPFGNTPSTRRP